MYSSLDPSEFDNYGKLKKALLKHYCLNKEAYLKRFREAVKQNTETHGQFHTCVKSLFEIWYRMTGAAQTYQDLREQMLMEQVFSTYQKDLVIFLLEHEPRPNSRDGRLL